jgi:signal recognition particle subunit SRP54
MVLGDLGTSITAAIRKLNNAPVVDEAMLKSVLNDVTRALSQADVEFKVVMQINKNIKKIVNLEELAAGHNKGKIIQDAIYQELCNMLDPGVEPYKLKRGKSNVVMFVGLQGSGKTTTIAKYAHYYNKKGWKTAMVCADTFRAGAFDQLKQNATKVRVPFYGSYTESDPVKIAEEGVRQFRKEKYELIIVDTSGRHRQEADLFAEMEQVNAAVQPDSVVFVMDATIGQAVRSQAEAFRSSVKVGCVIVTKLDGHAKGGGALSAVAATESPIVFIGTGEHFNDLEEFNAQSFVSRMLGRGDMMGLARRAQEAGLLEKQPEMMKRMAKGQFSLRDLYDQFQNLLKMGGGSIGNLMSMIPGMSGMMNNEQMDMSSENLQKFLIVMDSMTDGELDCLVPLSDSRVTRIARGSGQPEIRVRTLIQTCKQFEKMIGKLGKTGLLKNDGAMQQQMARDPARAMRNLAGSMDPRMLQQMGGMENMQKMMKSMSGMGGPGGGGMPGGMDMAAMQKMMAQMGGGGMPGMGGGGGRRGGGRRGRR